MARHFGSSDVSESLDPERCTTITKLWEELPMLQQLGAEVALSGLETLERMKSQAITKLVPKDLAQRSSGAPS